MKVLGNYLHDCQVDKDGNLWIAAARSGFVQKYSHDGKLLLQIGKSCVSHFGWYREREAAQFEHGAGSCWTISG